MWLDIERNSSVQRLCCSEEWFNFHSHRCLILFSRHSLGRQRRVRSAQLCARPDKGWLLSQQRLAQPRKSRTEECIQLWESCALPKQPQRIPMEGKAIAQQGAYCKLDWLGGFWPKGQSNYLTEYAWGDLEGCAGSGISHTSRVWKQRAYG